HRRVGGTDVVQNVYFVDKTTGQRGGRDKIFGRPDDEASLEAIGLRRYGVDWPDVREEVARTGTVAVLEGQVQSLGGEPYEIVLSKGRGSVLIWSELSSVAHKRNAVSDIELSNETARTIANSKTRVVGFNPLFGRAQFIVKNHFTPTVDVDGAVSWETGD